MNIIISNSGDKPIYEQITSQIKNAIISGELEAGAPLPSLRYLAKELRVSLISTKRAYEELEKDGFIESVQGKGSFVTGKNKELMKDSLRRLKNACRRRWTWRGLPTFPAKSLRMYWQPCTMRVSRFRSRYLQRESETKQDTSQ